MTPSDLFQKFSRFSSQLLSKKTFPIFQLQIRSRFRGLNKIAPLQHPPKIARVLGDVQTRTQTGDRPGLTKTLTDHPPVNPRRPSGDPRPPSTPLRPKPAHPAPPHTSPGGGTPAPPLEKNHPPSRKCAPVEPCTTSVELSTQTAGPPSGTPDTPTN